MYCQVIQSAEIVGKANDALPFFVSKVQAGFPSPADDFMDNRLNINDLSLIHI